MKGRHRRCDVLHNDNQQKSGSPRGEYGDKTFASLENSITMDDEKWMMRGGVRA